MNISTKIIAGRERILELEKELEKVCTERREAWAGMEQLRAELASVRESLIQERIAYKALVNLNTVVTKERDEARESLGWTDTDVLEIIKERDEALAKVEDLEQDLKISHNRANSIE